MDMIQGQFQALIMDRILYGLLPLGPRHEVFGGYGGNVLCACCGTLITWTEMRYDIEPQTNDQKARTLAMHLACYDAWVAASSLIGRAIKESQ